MIKTHRAALDSAGFHKLPLIVGTGVSSTWETIELTKEAAEAGGSFAMILPPGYFKSAMTDASIESFYTEVSRGGSHEINFGYEPYFPGRKRITDSNSTIQLPRCRGM